MFLKKKKRSRPKWAKAEGCGVGHGVMPEAAKSGHLEFAKLARAEGYDFGYGVMNAAALGGHLEFVQ